ncbi:MAG: phosphatase PAP2 family protein [Oscillospiraceae bacterium]
MQYITALDNEILWILHNTFSGKIFETIAIFIFKISQMGIVWLLIAFAFLLRKKYRKVGISVVTALFLSGEASRILSEAFYRMPPFMSDKDIMLAVEVFETSSFPSLAACMCFSAAVAFSMQYRQWSAVAVLGASLSAISLLYLMVCYPTDILAAIFVGFLCGITSVAIVNKVGHVTGWWKE